MFTVVNFHLHWTSFGYHISIEKWKVISICLRPLFRIDSQPQLLKHVINSRAYVTTMSTPVSVDPGTTRLEQTVQPHTRFEGQGGFPTALPPCNACRIGHQAHQFSFIFLYVMHCSNVLPPLRASIFKARRLRVGMDQIRHQILSVLHYNMPYIPIWIWVFSFSVFGLVI